MSKINMIHHINIQITDRERTREWYERVLGAEFLDRGPALNRRQLQFRLGTGEIHTSDTDSLIRVPRVHFAIEVEDFDAMLAHLNAQGVPYTRTGVGAFTGTGGEDPGREQGKTPESVTPTSATPMTTSSSWCTTPGAWKALPERP